MIVYSSPWKRFLGMLVALARLFTAQLAFCQGASMVSPFVDELPATTTICVWSDDARQLSDQWQQTALFQVYVADAMRPFWDEVRQKRGGLLPNEQLGLTWNELLEVTAGTWALAYDFDPDGQGTLLIIDVHGKEAAAVAALGPIQQRWQDRGMSVRQQPHPWGKLSVGERGDSHRWAFVDGGRLYLTDKFRLAESLIARREGKTEAALLSADIRQALSAVSRSAPRGSLRFYVDPWRLARYAAGARDAATATRTEFFERHGFRAIQAIVGHAVFQTGAHDLEFVVNVMAKFPLTDAAGLLSFASSQDFQLSPLVPSDAVGVTCLHLDVPSALRAYGFVYDDVYGEGYAGAFDDLLNSLREDPDGPQVDLQSELLDTLHGKISRAYDYGGAITTSNATGRRELWMAESAAPEKSARAVEKFYLHDPDVTSSSVQGVQIWHSRSDGPLLGGDPENPLTFPLDALCVMQGQLVLATDRQWLRELAGATTRTAPPFAGPMWQASSPTQGVAQSWRNLVPVASALHGCIQRRRLPSSGSWEEGLLRFLLSTQTERGRELAVDGTRLPPFSAIRHFFGLELIETSVDQQGWRLQGRLTRPTP